MHSGEPYGHMTVESYAALAGMVGASRKEVVKLLPELLQSGVFVFVPRDQIVTQIVTQIDTQTGHDSSHARLPKRGTLFSPRMVRDYEKHLKRQADGALGGNPAVRQVVNLNTAPEVKPSDTRDQRPERKKVHAASRQGEIAEVIPIDENPKAKLFRIGKTLLVSLGISEKQSGSVIGRWLKQKNDPDGILAALQYAADHGVIEPIGYVTRCLSKDSRIEKPSLADQARELANRARELEDNAGIGRPPASIGSV
jgi:hypothetical protein